MCSLSSQHGTSDCTEKRQSTEIKSSCKYPEYAVPPHKNMSQTYTSKLSILPATQCYTKC